jgi:DNA-directed RNA polymerase subunit M/transcription elongation factor TFIIS
VRQIFSFPVSYPQEAAPIMSEGEGRVTPSTTAAQKRKFSETEGNTPREETESRKGSGAMSYDPVHERGQPSLHERHSRRPSSAQSHHSHESSYSAHSSNQEGEEEMSPTTGEPQVSRDGKKRKHKCDECGQYFTRLHNLKSHLLTHSQEKPFICQECGHKFRRQHDLKRTLAEDDADCRASQITYWGTTVYLSRM